MFFIFKFKGAIEKKPNFADALGEKCNVTNCLYDCPARDSPLTCTKFTKTFIRVCKPIAVAPYHICSRRILDATRTAGSWPGVAEPHCAAVAGCRPSRLRALPPQPSHCRTGCAALPGDPEVRFLGRCSACPSPPGTGRGTSARQRKVPGSLQAAQRWRAQGAQLRPRRNGVLLWALRRCRLTSRPVASASHPLEAENPLLRA